MSAFDPVQILASDRLAVAYRPEFARYLGSVTAAILLQQVIFRWGQNGRRPFYKFKEAQSEKPHKLYREGDSWCEELAFSRREFEAAIERIGQKVGKGKAKDQDALVWYWINMDRVTYYELNEDALRKVVSVLYGDTASRKVQNERYVKYDSDFRKSAERTLDIYREEEQREPQIPTHSSAREEKNSFADPVLGTAAEEIPPVAPPPPFEPELAIVAKLDPGPNSQALERWCMKAKATAPEVQATFYDFAAWWIAKEGLGLSDTSIHQLVQNTGASAFRAAFEKSFITNFHRYKQQNANGQATGSRSENQPHDGRTETERIIERLASERAAIANRRAQNVWP